jgi:hypothetical protein
VVFGRGVEGLDQGRGREGAGGGRERLDDARRVGGRGIDSCHRNVQTDPRLTGRFDVKSRVALTLAEPRVVLLDSALPRHRLRSAGRGRDEGTLDDGD